jgi:hypothetical protein
LHLDSPLGRVGGDLEGIDGILEREAMGDEGLEVDQAARDEAEGFGVLRGSARISDITMEYSRDQLVHT